jgi:alkaline phosphatase D
MIPHNPHIKYYEGDKRGYFRATVTPGRMELELRFVTSVENPNGFGYTERSFGVEDRRPGVTLY